MATAKQVFDALPHVKEVWITTDGHHHLNSHKGGVKFDRATIETQEAATKVTEQAAEAKAKGSTKK
jgi:hypothetical protein